MKIIYGITDLANILFYMLDECGTKIDAFTVDKQYMEWNAVNGIPVIPYEELDKDTLSAEIYLAVGYRHMNRYREQIYRRVKADGFSVASFIHPTAVVSTRCLGEGTLIFEHAVVGPYVKLGNGNICYPKSLIAHHTVVGDFNFFAISSSVAGNVTVRNRCFFGNNSSTKDGLEIADETLVGAGAYVCHSTNAGECIVPAKSVILEKESIELL